jgi:glycosyltransferase involved in cell wall biosynthesis
LHILHIDTGSKWRGGQQQVWWLLEGLQRSGCLQTLAALPGSELAVRAAELSRKGAAVNKLHIVELASTNGRILSFENARIVRDAARACDLIHTHDAHAHTLAWGAQKISRGDFPPVVVARRVTFPIPWLGRLKNRQPAWFIAVSAHVQKILIASGIAENMTRVVHDGVQIPPHPITAEQRTNARQQLRLGEDRFVLGTLSSIAPEKMLEPTLRWAATLPEQFNFLLGVPERQAQSAEAENLRRLAAELGCASRVQLVPVGSSTGALLSAMDTFVYFSRSEGLGSAILLAMAHGLPVMASRTGGIPEIVSADETGILIDTAVAGWESAAREAAMALAADPGRRNRLGTQARAFAAEHGSSDNMVARTAAIYREILAARAGASHQTHT